MNSYHGDPALKSRFQAHIKRHAQEDAFLRGTYGEMHNGKFRGCAVGCSLRSLDEIEGKPLRLNNGSHADLANRLGIPLVLAHMEDRIFEGLPQTEAMLWPTLFAQAIPIGKDLSLVWPRFAYWMLVDPTAGVIRVARTDAAKTAINAVASLFQRQVSGGQVSLEKWKVARYAASAAAYATADASAAAYATAYATADATSDAAYAASAASDATYAAAASAAATSAAADAAAASAAYAAYAATSAATYAAAAYATAASAAARSRHFTRMAEKLLQLMGES